MNQFSSINRVSQALKLLVLAHISLSLFCVLFSTLFPHYPPAASPQAWFSLSLWGLKHYFLWQPLSYLFIAPHMGGLNFSFFLYLIFNMYFLWLVGSSVIERKGIKHFLTVYLGGGIFGGSVAAYLMYVNQNLSVLAGINPALYALLTAWMMLLPEVQVLLFFTIPVKIKWLILGILGINLFIDLSHGDYIHFALYFSSILFGYFYALIAWKTHSPFKILFAFEKEMIKLATLTESKIFGSATYMPQSRGKVYDFKTGKVIMTEDEFLDACLSKVSKHGKHSLTFIERWKMRRISKRRKKANR